MFTNVENINTTENGVDTPEPTEEYVAVESTSEDIYGEEPTEISEKKRTFGAHLLLQRQGKSATLKSVREPLYMEVVFKHIDPNFVSPLCSSLYP